MSYEYKCRAKQKSDQMYCHRCSLVWDVNDPEPPKCRKPKKKQKTTITFSESEIQYLSDVFNDSRFVSIFGVSKFGTLFLKRNISIKERK